MIETIVNEAAQTSVRCLKDRFKARMDQSTAMTQILKEKGRDHEVISLLEEDPVSFSDYAKLFFNELWDEFSEHEGVTHPFLRRFSEASLTIE